MRLARISFVFVACMLLTAVGQSGASAQQPAQEKRIALVVGNGAYAKGAACDRGQ